MKRMLFECTYVYDHPKDNSGIQRVVRNVINGLPVRFGKVECLPVVIKNNQIYRIKSLSSRLGEKGRLESFVSFWESISPRVRHTFWTMHARIEKNYLVSKFHSIRVLLFVVFKVLFLPFLFFRFFLRYLRSKAVNFRTWEKLDVGEEDVLVMLDSSWHSEFFEAIRKVKMNGAKVVGVVYDLIPLTHPQFCDDHLVKVFEQWFESISQQADGFMCISAAVANDVSLKLDASIKVQDDGNEKWVDHFYLGADLDLIDESLPVNSVVRDLYSKGESVYLMVSTIEPRKNHKYLLDVFDRLWDKGHNITLCFVGKVGWKCEELIRRIDEHSQYNKRLFLLSGLSDRDLSYCYANSRRLLFPSFCEGFGLPIIEAMQRGLPAFASDIPVFREIGGEYVSYFNTESIDSLIDLIDKEESELVDVSSQLKDWSWLNWAEATEQLLEKITCNIKNMPD